MLTLNVQEGIGSDLFINKATILNIQDLSGKPTYNNDPNSIMDLAVGVELDIGKSWTKKIIIKGNFKKEEGKIIDWGGAFVVKDFFIKTGCFLGITKEELEEKIKIFERKEIPAEFILKCRNKSIYILSYIYGISESGKPKYLTWNIVDTDPERLETAFRNSAAKGYPANYRPELLSENTPTQHAISEETEVDPFPF